MRRIFILLATAVLTAAALSGCQARRATADREGVVLMVDRSGSARDLAKRYEADFARLLERIDGGEHLLVQQVSAESLVEPVVFEVAFPAYEPFSLNPNGANSFTHGRAMKRLKAEAAERFHALLTGPTPKKDGTAIVDALSQAAELLSRYPTGKRTVVILSDMIEQSSLRDFTGLTETEIDPLLDRLAERHRLPDLSGTRVLVAGITDGGAGGNLSADAVLTVKRFWSRFFEKAGARLAWYGPTLTGAAD